MRNQVVKQPVQATTLTAEDIQTLKTARKQLWQAFAIIQIMSQSNHDEPMDYGVALEGVADFISDALAELENMSI